MTKIINQFASKVRDAIIHNDSFKENLKISVLENGGVITLRGEVSSREDKEIAELIAEEQNGVLSVVNELNIQTSGQVDKEKLMNIPPRKAHPTDNV